MKISAGLTVASLIAAFVALLIDLPALLPLAGFAFALALAIFIVNMVVENFNEVLWQ